ncbi:HWE histidine kinase domain-containing protein [Methylobacterium nonmethylotrophicum]|uniref:Blue-light-activated histidine kinase n=1 Tax=Methylobacterium nonmethylotrophicum TaxID=1141884 RepID=A0A4Z0NMB6_9HYPH|nr:HWE histidine kinase domain-containing protein [Methylobacterium nonmethylotrophicum]TGD97143.1 PAS domain-containing protein [Methylobacterium nonmethylotrophicum]
MRREADRLETEEEASEPDFRRLVESIPHLVWQSNPRGDWIWASRQWTAFTGQGQDRSRGYGWLDAVHPEDRARTLQAWQAASRRGHLAVEHRLCRGKAAETEADAYLWFSTRAMPRRGSDGRPTTWFGTSTDVNALHLLREAQDSLVWELQRQGRNNLAVIRGIVRRIADTATTAEDVVAHVEDRLAAMARIQAEVSREPLSGVALEMLIRDELSAHALPEPRELSGPPVRLPAEMAEKLGLALHELVLGAVLDGHDRIAVTWTATPTHLTLAWCERAGPGATGNRGGTRRGETLRGEMLERMLVYDLRATATVTDSLRERRIVILLPLRG